MSPSWAAFLKAASAWASCPETPRAKHAIRIIKHRKDPVFMVGSFCEISLLELLVV
jgi:hypothetical protein